MRRALPTVFSLCAAFAAVVVGEASAEAGELQLDGGFQAVASTWRGDYGGGTTLRFGYRFYRIAAIDAVIWESLMGIDTRLTTGLTLGVTGAIPLEGVRPTLRAFVIHQHEEPLVSAADAPFGTLFGIGAGIRHRAGGGGTLGLEIPFVKREDVEGVIRPGATFIVFGDDEIGPQADFLLGFTVGLNYSIEKMP